MELGLLVALLLIILLAYWYSKGFKYYSGKSSWPSTVAEITALDRPNEKRCSDDFGLGGVTIRYEMEFFYKYYVKGRQYTGNHIFADSDSEAQAVWIMEQYPPGTKVEAFYDPDNPQDTDLFRCSAARELEGALPVKIPKHKNIA